MLDDFYSYLIENESWILFFLNWLSGDYYDFLNSLDIVNFNFSLDIIYKNVVVI
jgi:hypothetical protein